MSAIRLNTAAINAGLLPYQPLAKAPRLDELLEELAAAPVVVSRRDVIKAAGIAAAVATGAFSIRTLEPLAAPEAGAQARGAWLRAGVHRATIDPSVFGGRPKLTVSQNGDWRAVLTGACFPGTDVLAGMDLRVAGTGVTSRLRVLHEFGGFAAEVPLAAWLAGEVAALSSVAAAGRRVVVGSGCAIEFLKDATASFAPDWSLTLEAPGLARVTGDGIDAVADVVTIALGGEAPSLLSRRIARRTLVTVSSRGGRAWTLPVPDGSGHGTVEFDGSTFDTLTFEVAQARSGAIHRAFVAQSSDGGGAVFVPRDEITALGAGPLALAALRYARLLDDSGSYHVAGSFVSHPQWVVAGGRGFLVGGTSWSPPFEMSHAGGRTHVSARPALRAIAVPFQGALASPIEVPEATRATLNVGDPVPSRKGSANIVVPGPVIGPIIDLPPIIDVPILLPWASTMTVLRPDDMLTLRFEFYNMSIVTEGQTTKLVRENPRKTPYVAVYFPPQHILEQAIKDVPATVAAQLRTPLKSYLTDVSRLVFKVPDDRIKDGIPYTLAGLLDWSGFTHRVVPAATRSTSSGDLTPVMREPSTGSLAQEVPPETSLELPWGLILSPYEEEWWAHRKTAFTKNERTELWHTRLRGGFLPVFGGGVGVRGAAGDVSRFSAAPSVSALPVTITPGIIDIIDPGDTSGIVGPGDLVPNITFVETKPTLRAVWGRLYDMRLSSPSATALPVMPQQGLWRNSFTSGTLADPPGLAASDDIGGMGNRWAVIDLTGRFREAPISVNRLLLTPMGAWLDSIGVWDLKAIKARGKNVFGNLTKWEHRMTMGRDQFVKIEELGRMFPWGHLAVEMTITERRVDPNTGLAFLGQKSFIVIKEPVRTYAQEGALLKRRLPFSKVEIKTKMTSQIDSRTIMSIRPGPLPYAVPTSRAYWVRSVDTGQDYLFKCEATDWDGVVHTFETPMIFMKDDWASNSGQSYPANADAAELIGHCSFSARAVQIDFRSQPVAFAKSAGPGSDKRVMPANGIWFEGIASNPATTTGDSRFEPVMVRASVRLDAVEELTGSNAGTTIEIADIYRDNGYAGANAAGRVFARIVSAPAIGFPASLSGALATPVPKLSGISATKGIFGGDLAMMGSGQFKPADFFDALNAKLLGGITLKDVIGVVLDTAVGAVSGIDEMPVFEKIVDAVTTKTLKVRYTWSTDVKREFAIFVPQAGCKLTLTAEVTKSLENLSAPPGYLVRGELKKFKLSLVKGVFDAITLTFDSISFESVNGSSPAVDPRIADVEFGGDLKYLAKLAQYLGALGGGGGGSALARRDGVGALATLVDAGPLKIDVSAKGVLASLTMAIPDLTIGVFSLTNMSFYAGLTLPFTGESVTLDFNFCSRESPASVMVMGFGGGFYALMTFDSAGMRALEIGIEFGAGTSFGIGGIASGMVEIKGGLSVRYERVVVSGVTSEKLDFVVYIRIHGKLDIMGLISVTLTFYLELRYKTFPKQSNPALKGDALTGTATLTIEIEILFFTIPVKLSVTKTLAGEDPRFGDLMPTQADWDAFCEAFAPAQLGA